MLIDGKHVFMKPEDIAANIVADSNEGNNGGENIPTQAEQPVNVQVQQPVLSPQEQRKARLGEIAKRIPTKGKTKLWTQAKAEDVAEYIMTLTDDVAKQQATVQQYIDNIKEEQDKLGGIEALELDEDIAFWESVKGLLTPETQTEEGATTQAPEVTPITTEENEAQPIAEVTEQPIAEVQSEPVDSADNLQTNEEQVTSVPETQIENENGNENGNENHFEEKSEMGAHLTNEASKDGIIDPRNMSDEERAKRGDMLRNATAVDVEEGLITSTKDLSARKVAVKWWDENVAEPAFYDTEVGEVEISRNSIESSLAHRYGQAKLDALTSLIEGFENAVYLGSMPDGTRHGGVMNHYFAYPIIYKGERCYVFCRAMHDANKNRLYVHEVFIADKIKKGDTLQTAASQPHGGIALYKDILANVLDIEPASTAEDTAPISNVQENSVKSDENTQDEGEKDVIEETREQNRVAEERQQRVGVLPRLSDYSAAISAGDTEAQKAWEGKFDEFLAKLTSDDLPAVESTIRDMQGRKSDVKAGNPKGYKENPNYKAFDYIEKALKKRKKELENSSTTGDKSQEIEDYSTNNGEQTEPTISQESEQVSDQTALIKGAKWEKTGEPEKMKYRSKKHVDSHDVTWYIGKKRYGSTTAERDLLRVLADEYGNLNAVWNAYEQNQIILSSNEAAILKKLIETNTTRAELQQGSLTLDRENPAFKAATEETMNALAKTGVEVVMATQEQVNEVLGIADAERQMIENANERFNRELDAFKEKKHKGLLHLGAPMGILSAAGVNARELTVSPTVLHQHLKKHNLTTDDLKGLAEAVQTPILVYRHGETKPHVVIVTELDVDGGKLSIALRLDENGNVVEVSNVSSVHSKDAQTELERLALLDSDKLRDYLRWVEKEKVSDWLGLPYEEERQDANPKLISVANVINDFENPKVKADFSRSAAPFYSNARRAVLDIKQEKATPEQWVAMLKKNGGLKAGEDIWVGLEAWLNGQEGTVTKQDILDYLTEHSIQIEEVEYSLFGYGLMDEAARNIEAETKAIGWDAVQKKYPGIEEFFEFYNGEILWSEENASVGEYEDFIIDNGIVDVNPADNAINETREKYTTEGLKRKREIALTVPTIEPYNVSDEVHFGDAGGGRAVAWVRFGETMDSEGKRVLVIDEVQSKRHQEGREKGYGRATSEDVKSALEAVNAAQSEFDEYNAEMAKKYGSEYDWHIDATDAEIDKWQELYDKVAQLALVYEDVAESNRKGIPSAPFEKNWHELAMKRMLRYAAENGFEKVAWTTGEQQAERYDMSRQVESVSVEENTVENFSDGTPVFKNITISTANGGDIRIDADAQGVIHGGMYGGKRLSDVVGKEFAERIMQPGSFTLEGESLRIGGEGMKGFYDKMLPSFVQKYTKKWGAKVGEVTMAELGENGMIMHSVDVTPAMADSVMQGQPMFLRTTDGTVYGWTIGGRIYLAPEGVNPNTPVHEYTHLWASAIEQRNPELWERVVDAMKLSPMWAEVMADEAYRDIWNDNNRMASEVLSRLSGEENYRRTMERAEVDIKSDRNPLAVAEKISAWERVKRALSDFWNKVKEMLGQPVTGEPMGDAPAWMEFVNGAIGDFYKGVNPNVETDLPQDPELMFIGEKGATALDKAQEATTRLDNLSVAREMEKAEKDAKSIKMATGWERGADGKWRYEVMDAKLKETLTIEGKEHKRDEVEMLWRSGKLADHVDNPALFDAYPELAEVRIDTDTMVGDNVSNGEYNSRTKTIKIHASEPKDLQSILNHEIQHAIQHIEGFAKGGNSESGRLYEHMTSNMAIKKLMSERNQLEKEFYESAVGQEVEREVDEWLDEHPDFNDEEAKKHEEYLFGKYPEYKDFLSRLAQLPNLEKEIRKPKTKYEAYRRLAGEVESRNVQKRMGMSEEERRNSLAEETEDVAREDQIFLYDNLGESALMGSRVDARMAEVAAHFDGKQLTEEQQTVVDVFGGKADNLTISVKTKDGNERKVVMRQGNEINAGTKHSLFRHYGMNNGAVTADDILLVPEIIENGERVEKKRGKKTVIEYKYTDNNGVEYTVITENNKGREEFANFYTNRKASSAARKTRSEEARDTADDASTDKGSNNSSTVQEEDTLFRDWYGGNSGYEGYSKSKRAVEAEERGLRSASQMNGEFAKQVNGIIEERTGEPSKLTLKDIKKVLPDIKADEWHHTSKFGNKTNYYSAENVASYFAKDPETELQERKEREIAEREEAYRRAVREKIPTRKVETELGEKDAFITSDGYAVEVPGNVLYMPEDARLFAIGELKDEGDYVVDAYSYWALENSEAFNKAVQEYVAAVEKAKNEVDAEIANDYREGEGSYTDDELALESDPVSKALGKPRGTRKQRREFAERERRRMVERVESLAKRLHLDNVEIVTDASTLTSSNQLPLSQSSKLVGIRSIAELEGKKQRAKGFANSAPSAAFGNSRTSSDLRSLARGFYSKSTGKITIVIPNHSSAFDVEQTLLHEAVAHYGLRQLFGKHFDTFLDNVFNNADVEVRKRIVKLAMEKYNLDFHKATEEYLASLAENTEFENYNASWWQKIKKLFLDMLTKVGVKLDFALSDNELRYILWRSYKNLTAPASSRSVIDVAEDIAKQYELSVGNYATPQGVVANVAEESVDDYSTEEQLIIDRAKADGTYMKAPNGKPTKLNPKQWVQVRTKAFKKWFGDWEKTARIEKLKKSEPVNIEFNNEYELNRNSAKQWMKDNLRREYTNADTGENITISKIGINEVTSHGSQDVAHLISLKAVPQFIENSVFIEEVPNAKDNDKYDSYRYYVCGARINGEDYTVKVVIGVKGDSKFYDHRLTQIEKGTLIDNLNGLSNSVAENQNTSLTGKDSKLISILQTNASKIVDENGEPKILEHSTWNDDFYTFDIERLGDASGDEGVYGAGFYFGNVGHTQLYGDRAIQVYLNMKRPMYLPDSNAMTFFNYLVDNFDKEGLRDIVVKGNGKTATMGEVVDAIKEIQANYNKGEYSELIEAIRGIWSTPEDRVIEQKIFHKLGFAFYRGIAPFIEDNIGRREFSEMLRSAGYDGVIFDNREWVAFSSNQIKSATDNVGTFSENDDDIRFKEGTTLREEYADKKRMSEWFSKQQYNSADVRNLFRHSAKVVENFENPKIEEDYLFREGDSETDAPNTKEEYEKNVQGFWNNFKEAWIDKTRALKAAQKAIEKTTGKKIADHSNVWMYANQMQGIVRDEMERFARSHFNTFGKFLKEMFKNEYLEGSNEEKQKQVERYTNCKHGIERNRDVAVKKAIADAADIEKVNRTFNKQLEKLTEENADSVILNLGMPAPLLQAAGVENKPMKLYGNKVVKKMKKHGFSIADLKDLPRAVAEPMAVFNNYGKDGNRAILTELITENGIFLVSVDLGKGADVDFNIITSVFGKDSESVIDWINKGFATYINKKKALAFLFHQSAPIAETAAKEELSSATKVVNSFNNPNVKSENVEYDKWLTEAENIHKMSLPWEEEQNMLDEAAKKYGAKLDTDYSGITAIFKDLKSYKDVKAA